MLDLIEHAGDRVIFEPEDLTDRDRAFERVLRLYPDMRIEMDEEGNILLMAPGGLESGSGSMNVSGQLWQWAKRDGTGKAFDSSTVFNLPTGAKMSPDASWVPKSTLAKFTKRALSSVTGVVIVPAFIVEVRSPSDRPKDQLDKCERWIKAGVAEAWMVDPVERKVHVFRPELSTRVALNPTEIASETLPGFTLDCVAVWDD